MNNAKDAIVVKVNANLILVTVGTKTDQITINLSPWRAIKLAHALISAAEVVHFEEEDALEGTLEDHLSLDEELLPMGFWRPRS